MMMNVNWKLLVVIRHASIQLVVIIVNVKLATT